MSKCGMSIIAKISWRKDTLNYSPSLIFSSCNPSSEQSETILGATTPLLPMTSYAGKSSINASKSSSIVVSSTKL